MTNPLPGTLRAAALACLLLPRCGGGCSKAECFVGPVAQRLGATRLLVGADLDDETAFHVAVDLRAQYVTGPVADAPADTCGASTVEGISCAKPGACGWWGCWQAPSRPPGDFIATHAKRSRDRGATAFFTYYTWLATSGGQEGEAEIHAMADANLARRYFADVALFATRISQTGDGAVVVHLEPDLWGFAQKVSPDARAPAAVHAGPEMCRGLDDTVAGFARCVIRIFRKRAPGAVVAMHASSWGALGADAFRQTATAFDVAAHARATAAYLALLGAGEADLVVVEMNHRDAGRNGEWWDATDATRPNFREAIRWASAVSGALKLPHLWWQVPLGHRGLANTCGAFEDNRLDYIFDHPDRFADAGALGVVFGAGEPCMTRPATDGGHFLTRANAFLKGAPGLCRP